MAPRPPLPDLLVLGGRAPDWAGTEARGGRCIEPGAPLDVRISGGTVVAAGPRLAPAPGDEVLHARGGVLLPGFHDHHLHLRALVAAERSAMVGPDQVRGRAALARALRQAPVDRRGWRRAVGYHESVAGELDRWDLDELAPGGPVRVQHRSGAMWMVSSAGVAVLGLDGVADSGVERDGEGRPTGRLLRMDDWLAAVLADADPLAEVARTSDALAARGVTGLTDATPGATAATVGALAAAVADGRVVQRLHVMCPHHVAVPDHPRVSRGPHKVLLDDDRLPALDDLVELVRAAHSSGSAVAVHCVTAPQLALAVTAFEEAGGAADRIEHGSVVPAGFLAAVAALRLTVVTNPAFVEVRGDDYLTDVDERDRPDLYRCASLLAAGVAVAAGTDAPFGPADPFVAVRAAVTRRTRRGSVVGGEEALAVRDALGLFTGPPRSPGRRRRLAEGEPGDLFVLDGGRLPAPGQAPPVVATVVAGEVVFEA